MSLATALHALGITGFVEDGRDLRFTVAATEAGRARDGDILVPLTDRVAITARGADAASFLQGQLSNDVAALAVADAQLTSYSNPKGRVLALGVLHRLASDEYAFEIDASLAADTFKRLRMYVLRSKLVLRLEPTITLGLAGPNAPARLADTGLAVPAEPWQGLMQDGVRVLRRPGATPRFSLQGDAASMARCWATLSTVVPPAGTAAWRLLDVDAGLPNVVATTRELFVPQMLNLDAIGGISFTKGCYPGQEIVARLHYLGSAKRRMFRATVQGSPPEPGAAVRRQDDASDAAAAGEIVEAAVAPDGHSAVLLVLQLAHAGCALALADGRPLTALEALLSE